MIKRKRIIIIVIVSLIIAAAAWWTIPFRFISISSAEVSKIKILDGGSGKRLEITDMDIIQLIVDNLSHTTLRKNGIYFNRTGFAFSVTIYRTGGRVYKQFYLNAGDTLIKEPFVYTVVNGHIDYEYIRELIKEQEG